MRHAKTSDAPAKEKRRKRSNLLSNILIGVGIILIAIAGGMWGNAQWHYHQQAKVNEQLAAYVTEASTSSDPSDLPKPPEVDWEGLKAINDDVVGWIQAPGTVINYPVYQGDDNNRYLRNTATGEWTWGGQLFLDYECTPPGLVDASTLIYGHHLIDGTMFKPIADMDKQENFDAVDTIWYVTEQSAWECEPLFLFYTNDEDQDVRTFNWISYDAFHQYLYGRLQSAITRRADAEQIIAGTAHVMCLITCNYYDGYGRTVLVCVPKTEAYVALAQAL